MGTAERADSPPSLWSCWRTMQSCPLSKISSSKSLPFWNALMVVTAASSGSNALTKRSSTRAGHARCRLNRQKTSQQRLGVELKWRHSDMSDLSESDQHNLQLASRIAEARLVELLASAAHEGGHSQSCPE